MTLSTMKNLVYIALAIIVLAMNCPPVFATQMEKQTMPGKLPIFKNVQDFIEFFRKGGEWYDKSKNLPTLMIDNQPDPAAMKVLGEELATGTENVRERIIDLLEEIGRLSHPGYELRTPEVIALMIGPGFAKMDSARSKTMDLLSKHASPATLSRYGNNILRVLKEEPSVYSLRLAAKAKPEVAREEVERLSRQPEWNERGSSRWTAMRIASAALGDTKIEDEYIAATKRVEAEGDAEKLSGVLYLLAQIGTPRSLLAVCERMRSPLIIDSGVFEESVRLKVMDALLYAFPGQPELYSFKVTNDADYMRAEQFCMKATGVRYDGIPRPEYFGHGAKIPAE